MDIVGITFDGELQGYIDIKSIKVSKWINPDDLSLQVSYRLTVEHKYGEEGFKKIEKVYVYFSDEDFENFVIDKESLKKQKRMHERSRSNKREERELQKRISPMEGYIPPILAKRVIKEDEGEKRRIKVELETYEILEMTKNRKIYFPLRFERSIDLFEREGSSDKGLWLYDSVIGIHGIQTFKWSKEEFMPLVEKLEVWLQIPKELYRCLSAINILPVDKFKQMFLLEEDMAKKFYDMGQKLAKEDTLCINWSFSNVGMSSSPQEIEVTCGLKLSTVEPSFVRHFEDYPEKPIIYLRQLLYECKVQTIDFNCIISGISDETLKKVLEIFNIMILRKGLRPMKKNLKMLLPLLEELRGFPYGEEFYNRYDTFGALLTCEKSEDFFSDEILSKFNKIKDFCNKLDPDYVDFMQDLTELAKLTKRFNFSYEDDKPRHKREVLEKIDEMDDEWGDRLVHPDKYVLYYILINWKNIIEKEYEEQIPKPRIDATIKTKRLALADKVGIVLSVSNHGKGTATDVQACLLEGNDYSIIKKKSETKAHLAKKREFEPELIIAPKDEGKITVSYEICYKDPLGREDKIQFGEIIEIIRKKIPFQKVQNPYIVGDVVREKKMFYGREELIQGIIDLIKGKHQINPIFLHGQRRTGKTSVLYHLKKEFERKFGDQFIPVLFDISQFFGKKSFYQDLMEEIEKEIGGLKSGLPDIEDDPFDDFMNKFYSGIKEKLNGKKIILMIDEYQKIDTFINEEKYDVSVIDFIDALVQKGEIKVVIAGFLQADELQNEKWVGLMRLFQTKNVSFLEREDTLRLIKEPVKDYMEYDDGATEKIISLSACHPYFVQLICHSMVEYCNRSQTSLIAYETIADHLFNYFERGRNVFLDIINTQTGKLEQQILLRMCELMEKERVICVHKSDIELNLLELGEDIGKLEIERALSFLERKEIVRKTVEHPEYYEFTIDLYRHWVKWNVQSSLEGKNE